MKIYKYSHFSYYEYDYYAQENDLHYTRIFVHTLAHNKSLEALKKSFQLSP